MNPEEAQEKLLRDAYVPVFMQKLAAAGIQIKDEDELRSALSTAAMLKLAKAQVGEDGSPIKTAEAMLKQAMQIPDVPEEPVADPELLQAALALSGQQQ